jgi:hypothetical protein
MSSTIFKGTDTIKLQIKYVNKEVQRIRLTVVSFSYI